MKKELRDQLEGGISTGIDAKVTPITRQAIRTVDAGEWTTLTLTELYDQLATLDSRRIQLYDIGQPMVAQQVEQGIAQLQSVIKSKTDGMPRLL